jgi:RHS repeat-associated protein
VTAGVLLPVFFFSPMTKVRAAALPSNNASANSTSPSLAARIAKVASVGKVKACRTVPRVPAPPSKQIIDFTEDDDFFRGHVFAQPLVAKRGKSSVEENKALAKTMDIFSKRAVTDDFSGVEEFLGRYPDSKWSVSLLSNLATSYFKSGYFSKALQTWESVWSLGKEETEPDLKAVVDDAVAQLAKMNARIGRFDRLETLFREIGSREIRGSATELIVGAKDALSLMKTQPDELFRCGPLALGSILGAAKGSLIVDPKVAEFKSTTKGTSLAQLVEWAKKVGLNYQVARREAGAVIITPSVVHWKVGHFAALMSNDGGKIHVQDPTFAEDLWISPAALDAEASGYFLVPAGKLPAGWSTVPLTDAKEVWGKGGTAANDPDRSDPCDEQAMSGCGSCGGMARYNVHAMLVSLNITDTPVFYNVAFGPSVDFTVRYNQRESHQPAAFDYANLGNKWTPTIVSYVTDDSTSPSTNATLFVQGGGQHTFKGFNPSTNSYAPEYRTQAVLVRTTADPITYELRNSDGSKQIFSVPNGTLGPGRKVFLKQTIDPMGNALTYTYSGQRVTAMTDATGLVTTIEYKTNTIGTADYYRIGKISNPFGRFATFDYNSAGQLATITDMIGIQSAFQYGSGDYMSTLTTPYGATSFAYGDSGTVPLGGDATRWVEITDPLGAKERVEYRINAPGVATNDNNPPSMPSPGAGSYYLNYRNTFYWSKKAMMEAPGDYTQAKIFHWLHSSAGLASGTLESIKNPLENRMYYLYKNQGYATSEGPNELPVAIGRRLDNNTDQVYKYDYNNAGQVTKITDPSGRVTALRYDPNNIDVTDVYQQNSQGHSTDPFGVISDKLGSFTYNNKHEPLTFTDASGQVATCTYNAQGQLRTIENARHEITTRNYDLVTGRLMNITGALPGATTDLTYDDYGHVNTIKDSEGYIVVIGYDELNRATQVSYPDNTYEQIIYSRLDPEWGRDRLGRWTHYFHDALQHLVAVEDPELRLTRLNWCTCGSLESIVDPNGNKTTWTRDVQSRVTSKIYPGDSTITYGYENAISRLKSITDAKSQRTNYTYYADNDLKQISYSDTSGNALAAPNIPTPTVNFTYDPVHNRVATMTDGTGLTTYAYNPVSISSSLGAMMPASIDGPLANDTIAYGYDELGRSTNRSINGAANASSVHYDGLGRTDSATNPLGTFAYVYRNTTDRMDHIDYPHGQKAQYDYFDNLGNQRLKQIENLDQSGAAISQFDYDYNPVGDIKTWTQTTSGPAVARRYEFGYDKADQLRSASLKDSGTHEIIKQYHYDYDQAGNRTIEQINTSTATSGHNNLNQLKTQSAGGAMHFTGTVDEPSAVTVNGARATVDASGHFDGTANLPAGTSTVNIVATDVNDNTATNHYQVTVPSGTSKTLLYDPNGNLVDDGSKAYEWDAANRCVAINQGTHRTEFSYDGFSREAQRTEKENGAVVSTKQFIWCGLERCEERDANDSVTKRFYWQGEQIDGSAYFYSRDHLGSIRELTDEDGVVRARYDYDPWGRRSQNLISSAPVEADFGFTGHYVSSQYPDFAFAPFRIYSASLGRWMSRDPIGEWNPDGPNLYTYVRNAPSSYVDPDGRFAWIIAGAVIGAAINVGITLYATGGNASWQQIGAAAAGGAIAGAIGAVAGPLAGTLARGLGAASNGLLASVASAGLSAGGSALGQGAANLIDPCHASSLANAALWGGLGGGLAKGLIPTRNLNTWAQAQSFGPSTFSGLFGSSNAGFNMGSFGASSGLGAAANFPGPWNPF